MWISVVAAVCFVAGCFGAPAPHLIGRKFDPFFHPGFHGKSFGIHGIHGNKFGIHGGFPSLHGLSGIHGFKRPKFIQKVKTTPKTTTTTTETTTQVDTTSTTQKPRPKPHKFFLPPLNKPILSPRVKGIHGFPSKIHGFHGFKPTFVANPKIILNPKAKQPEPEEEAPATTFRPLDTSFCFDKKDGMYADESEQCAAHFIFCTAGAGRIQPCAGGTYWDRATTSCQYKKYVPECGGSLREQDVTTENTVQDALFDFDCSDKADGAYENPNNVCSPDWVVCSGNVAWFHSCPPDSNTFYDILSDSCLAKEYVKWCGGHETEATTEQSQGDFVPPFEYDCFGLPDGQYEDPRNPCSADYVSCVGGETRYLKCYGNLKYDILSDMCLSAVYVKWCGGVSTEKPEEQPGDVPANPGIQFDCVGKPDGDYENPEDGCSRYYFSCSGEVATFRFCHDETLRYDVVSGQCLAPEYTPWCGGQETTQTTAAPRDETTTRFAFDCTDKADGDYDNPYEPCSADYVSCVGGSPRYRACGDNLVFDWDSKKCINAAYVASCHGHPTPHTDTQDEPQKEPANFDCSGLATGYYPDPTEKCSDRYFSCNEGFAEELFCGPATAYDVESGDCLDPAYVLSCHGISTNKPDDQNEQPEADPFCEQYGEGSFGGIHGEDAGCTKNYFVCTSGNVKVDRVCIGNTFWDKQERQCLHKRQVPACGGSRDNNKEPEREEPQPAPVKKAPHPIFTPKAVFAPKIAAPKIKAPKVILNPKPFVKSPIFSPKIHGFPGIHGFKNVHGFHGGFHGLKHFSPFHAPAAPVNTKPFLPIDCRFAPDGRYGEKCGRVFFTCEHGVGKGSARCPPGEKFDSVECVPEDLCH